MASKTEGRSESQRPFEASKRPAHLKLSCGNVDRRQGCGNYLMVNAHAEELRCTHGVSGVQAAIGERSEGERSRQDDL
ncbi:MAG: hypothetical protein OXE78_09155 [Gammaproteobacteria bacterium]|nr:hypothetical protein [Gammaproteobacteria bacterium]